MSARPDVDLETVELLSGEPTLLAIADAINATQPRRPRREFGLRAVAAAVVGLAAVLAVLVAPGDDADGSALDRALAAIGPRAVVHAVIEARVPTTNVVDLATGRASPQTVRIEYWFDEERSRLRTVHTRGGVVVDERLSTRGAALDPALRGFVTRYRDALASGAARETGRGRIGTNDVVWIELSDRSVRERVAIDADSHLPVRIVPLDRAGRGGVAWRVVLVETVARDDADFAPRDARAPAPFRGDVREVKPLSSAQAQRVLPWNALWLGRGWRGLPLVALDRETLSRGYPPGVEPRVTLGQGLRLRYALDGGTPYVEVAQAPVPEPAYGFFAGTSTYDRNPVPREGHAEVVELGAARGGATTWLAQLRRDGVFVTIWSSSRNLAVDAARDLRRMGGE